MKLMNDLEVVLMPYKKKPFTLMINHQVVSLYLKGKVRVIRVKYDSMGKEKIVSIGSFIREDGKVKFIDLPKTAKEKEHPDEGTVEYIEDILNDTNLFGFDFSKEVKQGSYTIDIDPYYSIIHLKTNNYILIEDLLIRGRKDTNPRYRNGTIVDKGALNRIFSNSLEYYLANYQSTYNVVLSKKLRTTPSLAFYNLNDSFVPLMLSSKFLYNPFTQHPLIKDRFLASELYNLTTQSVNELFGLKIGYITYKEICQGFHLDKFCKLPWQLTIQLLSGFFSDEYPNLHSNCYIKNKEEISTEGYALVLNEQEYEDLPYSVKPFYTKYISIQGFCIKYYAVTGAPKVKGADNLADILSKLKL